MALIGTSNRMALRYVSEVTFGTTPATPTLKGVRLTGESVNYNISNITSNEIRSDRMRGDPVQVSGEVGGDINFELSYGSFDDFITSALCGEWGAPVSGVETIKNGTTASSFTLQKHVQDITTPVYMNFLGCRVGSMELSFQTGSIVTGKFGFMGLSMTAGTSQIAGATTPAISTTIPLNAVSNITQIKEDGVTSTNYFNRFSLTLNNNLRVQRAVGQLGAIGIAYGAIDISGNIEVFFQDKAMLDKYIAGTAFSLYFKFADSANNTLIFTLPRVKFESAQVVAGGLDQDLMLSGTWRAAYDSGSSCMIQIDRDATPPGP